MTTLTRTAQPKDEGRKLKYFVRSDMGMSYHQFASLKVRGALTVNGAPARANHILRDGDVVCAALPEDAPALAVEPEFEPVSIVYEDGDLLIVDKPAPLSCQRSPRQSLPTLENRLAAYFADPAFVFRPLNRLDKGTSGLMAVAKHAHSYQLFQKLLHTDRFVREYLAVVEGRVEGAFSIDAPIAKVGEASVKRTVDLQNGKPSVTHVRAEGCFGEYSLVRLRLETGRTHQIRVHLSHIGHPVAGDFLYGHEDARLPGRFALHSARIMIDAPERRIDLASPLPPELQMLIDAR
ncbi:MAG: RluA family pseudouridine synthase [Clostridiales bacterium]|nr:RluA family pseudouridine synthase [Clostridiales bacterium]OPZ67058.1 MAG: Ribosomal large subunit pseudouridine synthase D [Firmicutes bacterium ADurb.Bin467]